MNFLGSIFETLSFFLFIVICFYLPGRFFSNKFRFKLNLPESLFFNTLFGLAIFTLISYALSWIKLTVLLLPIFLLISFISIKEKSIKTSGFDKRDWPYLVVIFISALIFCIPVILSGQFGNNIRFFGVNAFDSLWHLSLINELKYHFPPDNPGFAGIPLIGYHFFFNFLLAKISAFYISPLSLYFRFIPPFLALLWGIGVYALILKWTKSREASLWAVFLTIFGGSFAFILRLEGHPGSLDDALGMTQPYTALLNPPFAISIVLIIAFLFSLYQYLETKNKYYLYPLAVFAGIATMFKVYAGIILLGGFGLLTIIQFFRKDYFFILSFFGSLILFYFTYWILRDPSSRLIFDPLWSPHKVLLDNLPWYRYDEKFYTYSRLHVKHGLFEIESFALLVFIVGNLGSRVIGMLFNIFAFLNNRKTSLFAVTMLLMLLISLLIPMFFIQSGKVFEIIQMTWYFLFFSAFFAAAGFGKFFSLNLSKLTKGILIITVVLITFPSAYEKITTNVNFKGGFLSPDYYKATEFMKSQGVYNSTILEIPPSNIGIPLNTVDSDAVSWFYTSSSPRFIALSEKRGFLNNEGITFTGTDFRVRLELITSIIKYEKYPEAENYFRFQPDIEQGLKNYKIKYIYSPYSLSRLEKTGIIKKIFENPEAFIYIVNINGN